MIIPCLSLFAGRRALRLLTAVLLLAGSRAQATPYGDLTDDGAFRLNDVNVALRIAVGLVSPRLNQLIDGDVAPVNRVGDFGDGRVDLTDVTRMLRRLIGIDAAPDWPGKRPYLLPTSTPELVLTRDDLDYFVEVTMGSEYGGNEQLHKWTKTPVEIEVHGSPDSDDSVCLNRVITDFNALSESIRLERVATGGDLQLYFAPESRFKEIEPNYVPINLGFFWIYWDAVGALTNGAILIDTSVVTPTERCHLIREELTQSMGLMRDSDRYPDSIFYAPWTSTTSYSDRDMTLIRMLYATDIPVGSTLDQVIADLGGFGPVN